MKTRRTVLWMYSALFMALGCASFGQPAASLSDDVDDSPPDNWLPVTSHGSYSNIFLVYQDPLFDFVLDGKGAGWLHLKDNQAKILKPAVRLGSFGLVYVTKGAKKMIARKPQSINEANLRPAVNPQRVEFSGVAEDDVTFSRSYEFGRGEIKAQFRFDEPKSIEPPTLGRTSVQFVKHTLPGTVEQHQALLSSWTASIQAKGGRKEFNYWDSVDTVGPDVSKVTVQGPWGTRTLEIQFTPMDAVGIHYKGNPLYRGYGFIASAGGKGKYAGNRVGIKVTVK